MSLSCPGVIDGISCAGLRTGPGRQISFNNTMDTAFHGKNNVYAKFKV